MANFHYVHPADEALPDVITTGGTANTAYPLVNATDFTYKNIANPSKLTGTSGDWILDFGSAQRIDAIVLWHNFDSALAYSVQMNATNSWGGPTVDLSTTAPTKRQNGYTLKAYHNLTGVTGYSSGGFRYLRVNVTGTNSAPVGIKILIYSGYRQTTRNIQWGWNRDLTQTGVRMATDARVRWAYDLTAAPRILKATILGKDADYAALLAWVDACAGFVNPTVIVPDPTTTGSSCDAWLGYLSDGSTHGGAPSIDIFRAESTYDYLNANPLTVALEEITAGDPEWY